MDYVQLYHEINRADVITLFRHQRPDCDAVGSQFALKKWIRDNFPQKKVYALGYEYCKQGKFPHSDTADAETIKNSIAIVLDTANSERVDDERFQLAKRIIRVDHHPFMHKFGDEFFINDKAAATCEILADFFRHTISIVSLETAEYLYMGLLTDTLCFKTSNTTAETLKAAAYLAGFSVDIPVVNQILFDKTEKEFLIEGHLHDIAVIGDHTAYAIVSVEEQKAWGLEIGDVRDHIDVFSQVEDFEVWALFNGKETEDGQILYDGSLRSKRTTINEIASDYCGGGHKNASGVKNMTEDQMYELIGRLKAAARRTRS